MRRLILTPHFLQCSHIAEAWGLEGNEGPTCFRVKAAEKNHVNTTVGRPLRCLPSGTQVVQVAADGLAAQKRWFLVVEQSVYEGMSQNVLLSHQKVTG